MAVTPVELLDRLADDFGTASVDQYIRPGLDPEIEPDLGSRI
jgi:hypothetical protein